MDAVGQPLSKVTEFLSGLGIVYKVITTQPTRNLDQLDEENLFVVRQQIDEHGMHSLVVAAKMKGAYK